MIPSICLQTGLGNTPVERLHQKTSVLQPVVPVRLEGAVGEGIDRSPFGWGMRCDLSDNPKELQEEIFQSAQMQKTQAEALYIIFNKSAHAQVLQRVQHLITHRSQPPVILLTARAPWDRWRREKKRAFIPTQEFPCFGKCKLEHYY